MPNSLFLQKNLLLRYLATKASRHKVYKIIVLISVFIQNAIIPEKRQYEDSMIFIRILRAEMVSKGLINPTFYSNGGRSYFMNLC